MQQQQQQQAASQVYCSHAAAGRACPANLIFLFNFTIKQDQAAAKS
jgi:hypothetical protein